MRLDFTVHAITVHPNKSPFMNKFCSLIQSVGIVAGVTVVTAAVSALILPGSPKTTSEEQVAVNDQAVRSILQAKCAECHIPGYQVPDLLNTLSGGLVRKHMNDGLRAFNLKEPLTQVSWAKLEHAISSGSMPPASFTAVHWGSLLTPQEKSTLLTWIHSNRTASAQRLGVKIAEQFQGEPILPLPDALPINSAKAAVGQMLFNDKRLSVDNTVSCATCHALDKAGTDNLPVSVGVKGQKGGINAPTVFNAALHFIQFWDGRAANLQEQAGGPPLNPVEMGYSHPNDWQKIAAKLSQDPAFSAKFFAVYPEGFTGESITNAIAEYERTLITPNSPFDRYLKGDDKAICHKAKEGYALFKKYGCQTCHNGVGIGGQSFEFADLKGNFFGNRTLTADDNGRMNFTKSPKDQHKFKVPTLRNVALTWPYMHDASATTLPEAVVKMFQYQIGSKEVSDSDVSKITAFLHSLTGEFNGKPLTGTPYPGAVCPKNSCQAAQQ